MAFYTVLDRHALGTRLSTAILCALVACDRPAAPCVFTRAVVAPAGNDSSLSFVDANAICRPRTLSVTGTIENVIASSSDDNVLVIDIQSDGTRELVSVAVPLFAIVARQSLAGFGQQNGGTTPVTGEAAAVDGDALYLWRTDASGTLGIGRFSIRSTALTAFSGPWNLVGGGLIVLSPSTMFPRGALVGVGLRSAPGPRNGQSRVFFLDPLNLAVIDSILPSDISGEEDVWQFVPTGDPQTAFIVGATHIIRYDLSRREAVAATTRDAPGFLVVANDSTLLLTDGGIWPDSPGSGLLRLYDWQLRPAGEVDVSTPVAGSPNSPTATRTGIAIAAQDGRTVFVRGGSEVWGPLYAPQPARLFRVDVLAKRLVSWTSLGGYGLGPIAFAATNNSP